MGLLTALGIGKAAGEAAAPLVGKVFEGLDSVLTSDEERETLRLARLKLEQQPLLWQALQNQIEGRHRSLWVAGWRPSVGWTCASALAYYYLIYPLLLWVLTLTAPEIDAPMQVDINALYPLLLTLLGTATLRSVEKSQGLTN